MILNIFYLWSILLVSCDVIHANNNGTTSPPTTVVTPTVKLSNACSNASDAVDTLNFEFLRLIQIPSHVLLKFPCVRKLYLGNNRLRYISKDDFPAEAVQNLFYIGLHDNLLDRIHPDAFDNMPNLIFIDLSNNKFKDVPIIKAKKLEKVYFSRNKLQRISPQSMQHYESLKHIEFRFNQIEEISDGTFNKNKELIFLDLESNPLQKIENHALVGPKSFKYLHLRNTHLSSFPSHGISELELLDLTNVPQLFKLPRVSKFKKLKDIFVTHSALCCPFRRRLKELEYNTGKIIQCNETNWPKPTLATTSTVSTNDHEDDDDDDDDDEGWGELTPEETDWIMGMLEHDNSTVTDPCDPAYWHDIDWQKIIDEIPKYHVNCKPEPDAFNPCDNVMGTDVLRAFSWIISVFAVIGNIFQLVVLFHSKQKCVYKLLMYNLGISNLLMGVYLLILCCVDAYTYGEYYNYVQSWQYNGGCQGFGFLAVFSTSLSVCSLVLITLERFLLIVFALEHGYQMHIKHAKCCIAFAWVYSFIVAILPATNIVSSYAKTAICLPMDVHSSVSESYVIWLLVAYVISFIMIVYCYVRMYRLVKDVRPVGGNNTTIDTQVAKRMALIIFSNFLCWLPISFTGFVAMYSGITFDVNVAKFMIVFIFPLNACTNPFLYTIFTKIFREDTLDLLYKLRTRSRTSSDRSENRDRSISHLKSDGRYKTRSANSTPMHLHVQPPSYEGNTYLNGRQLDTEETDFYSPETPMQSIADLNSQKMLVTNDTLSPEGDVPPLYDEIDDNKVRSNSTRGLLEEYREQEQVTENPYYTPFTESPVSSTPLKDTSTADGEESSNVIGSVKNVESSILKDE